MKNLLSLGKQHNFARDRGILAFIISEIPFLTLTELGKLLNRDITTLSIQALKIKKACFTDKELAKQIDLIRSLINEKITKTQA